MIPPTGIVHLTCRRHPSIVAPAAGASTYTVDGKPADRSVAIAAAGGCIATADANDVIACFSSDAVYAKLVADQLEAGKVPPGYGSLPPVAERRAVIRASRTTAASSSRRPSPTARKADSCDRTNTHVYTGAGRTGLHGQFGRYTTWQWHSSDFYGEISSYWASVGWKPQWRDSVTTLGGGSLYDLAYVCRQVDNLANGAWDDRFTQFIAY